LSIGNILLDNRVRWDDVIKGGSGLQHAVLYLKAEGVQNEVPRRVLGLRGRK
jgi:hypothetical protein